MSRMRRCVGWGSLIAALLLLAGFVVMPLLRAPRPTATAYTATGRPLALPEPVLPDGTIDVNRADLYELTELYGIGETLAQAILDEREAHGPFSFPEDLLSVRGIGGKKLAGFREMLDFSEAEEDVSE